MKQLVSFVASLVVVGCSYSTKLTVRATDLASIHVDGFEICDNVPCEIELKCDKDGFLPKNRYQVEALPKKRGQYTQTRTVDACNIPSGTKAISFEMGIEPAPRRQETDIRISPGK